MKKPLKIILIVVAIIAVFSIIAGLYIYINYTCLVTWLITGECNLENCYYNCGPEGSEADENATVCYQMICYDK